MFESSLLLFLEYVLLNIFIPFIPWLLFLWIFYVSGSFFITKYSIYPFLSMSARIFYNFMIIVDYFYIENMS